MAKSFRISRCYEGEAEKQRAKEYFIARVGEVRSEATGVEFITGHKLNGVPLLIGQAVFGDKADG